MDLFLKILLLMLLLILGYFSQSSTVMYASALLIGILVIDASTVKIDLHDYIMLVLYFIVIIIILFGIAQFLNFATTTNLRIFGQEFTKGSGFLKYEGDILSFLKKNAVTTGILFLMLYALIPIAQGEITIIHIAKAFITWKAWICIATGIGITLLAKYGVPLMEESPDVLVFLVVGIIVGVVAFKGFPTGPLIGSGIAYFMFIFVESIIRFFERLN